ncbi:terpenoid synthase [Penicillium sp. CMV-2018d]|nr:terpenoid synthase [Penicillium sp. CMV-2018d]
MANDTQFEPSFLKPIRFTYDLDLGIYSIPSKVDSFNFLERYRHDAFENDNSVLIKPSLLRLPWPSAFQDARQCKYWREAKYALERFLDEIYSLAPEVDGLLPNLHCSPESLASRCDKGQAVIDTAVSAAVYMNPEASPIRISLIAKCYLLAWLHDDVFEHNPEYASCRV